MIEKVWLKRALSIVGAITIVLAAAWVSNTIFSQRSFAVTVDSDEVGQVSTPLSEEIFTERLAVYDFEEGLNSPWDILPSRQEAILSLNVDSDKQVALSGEKVLNIEVNFTEENNSTVLESTAKENDAEAILGYVYVPESRRSAGKQFYGQWVVSSYFGTESDFMEIQGDPFESPEIMSSIVAFRPGKWTPIFLSAGTGYRERGEDQREIIWKRGIYGAHLVLWSNEPYAGPIYVDHIEILKR